ncbi:MAG TPA: prepilin-type N-terminal cleavage/methylation domain-containing protein [Gemmata sp.]
MKLISRTHGFSAAPAGRRAFTLIELLVVISIIALMTGLIVAGTMRFKDSQVVATTDAQVTRFQQALDTDYKQVVQKCQKEGPPAAVQAFCGGNDDRARAVHTAATLRINFPETFAEATTAFDIGGFAYRPQSLFKSVAASSGASAEEQRAVLLFLILTERATAGGTGNDMGSPGERRTTKVGGADLTYFIDLYGTPIVYSRWAQNTELNAPPFTPASPISKDPLDPKNLVATWSESGPPVNTAKRDYLRSSKTDGTLPNLVFNGENRVPTVVSAGKNKAFNSFGGDDRVGYRLARFGAKGDGK